MISAALLLDPGLGLALSEKIHCYYTRGGGSPGMNAFEAVNRVMLNDTHRSPVLKRCHRNGLNEWMNEWMVSSGDPACLGSTEICAILWFGDPACVCPKQRSGAVNGFFHSLLKPEPLAEPGAMGWWCIGWHRRGERESSGPWHRLKARLPWVEGLFGFISVCYAMLYSTQGLWLLLHCAGLSQIRFPGQWLDCLWLLIEFSSSMQHSSILLWGPWFMGSVMCN